MPQTKTRPSKLKTSEVNANDFPSTPPLNAIDPNFSNLAKISLKADFTDLRAEIDATRQDLSEETSKNSKAFKRSLLIFSLSFIVVASAIAVTIFQSMLLSANYFFFPFPIFSAAVTNFVQLFGALLIVGYYGRLGRLGREFFTETGWKATYQAILPCSLVTAAELSFSLVSLQYVTVSFFTMVKSSSIVFILLGAFITGQERVSVFLISVIFLTGVGVILAAWDPKSTAGLEVIGFSLVLLSSILNAGKWILTELLLNENVAFQTILTNLNVSSKEQGKTRNLTPILSVLLIAPITFAFLLIGTIIFEGFPLQIVSFMSNESIRYTIITVGSLSLSSLIVFVMRVADFRLVQLVSLVTFSLLGIIKEIFMILISVVFLGEILFPVNVAGLIVTIVGVVLYNYYRALESKREEVTRKGNLEIELQLTKRKRRNSNEQISTASFVK